MVVGEMGGAQTGPSRAVLQVETIMTCIPLSFRFCVLTTSLMVALLGAAPSTRAATLYSNPTTGVWTAAETWQGGSVPTNDLTTDLAVIVSNATVTVDDTRSVGACIVGRGAGTAGTLHIARDFTLGTYNLVGGVRFFIGGLGGSGVADQATGTTVRVTGRMCIGPDPGLTGVYTLPTNATLNVDSGLWIGNNSSGTLGNGALTIDGGTLNVGAGGTFLSGGSLTLNGGTLTTSVALDVGALNNPNTPHFELNAGTATVTGQFVVGANGTSSGTQYGGVLQVNGTFYAGGYGSNAVAGTGTYTQVSGDVTVLGNVQFNGGGKNAGIYNLNGGILTVNQVAKNAGTGAATFNFNGGTLRPRVTTGTFMQGLNAAYVQSGGAVLDTAGFAVTMAQPLLAGTPSGGLTKRGAGKLTLTGLGTFTGGVDIVEGVLVSQSGKQGQNPTTSTLGNPQVARTLAVHPGATLIFAEHDQLGNAGTAVKATVLVQGGTVSNTNNAFTPLGRVILDGGTLACRGGNNGWNTFYLKTNVVVAGSAPSVITGDGTAYAACDLAIGGTPFQVADVTADTNADLVVSTALANPSGGVGGLLKNGPGTMALAAATRFTGDTRVNAGALALAHPQALQYSTLDWNNYGGKLDLHALTNAVLGNLKGAQAFALPRDFGLSVGLNGGTYTYSGILSGTNASLTKVGAGTLALTANSTFSGPTTILAGTLQTAAAGSVYDYGRIAGVITVRSGGALHFNRHDTFGIHNANPVARVVVEAGGLVQNGATYTTLKNLTLNGGELRANGGANATFQAYQLKGTVTVGGSTASRITATRAVNALTGIQLGTNVAGSVTTFDVADATGSDASDLTCAAPLTDGIVASAVPCGLVKAGAGTLELTGTNTYSGATRLTAGTLLVNGRHTGGATYAVDGGVLGGVGVVGCSIGIGAAGTLAPGVGATPGLLTVNAGISFAAGGKLLVDIGEGGADRLAVSGGLLLAGARLGVTVADGFAPVSGAVYPIVTGFSNPDPGTFDGLPQGGVVQAGPAAAFVIDYDAVNRQIILTAGRGAIGTVLIVK